MDMAQAKTNGEASTPQTTTTTALPIGKPADTPAVGKGSVRPSVGKNPTVAELQAELAKLQAENTALKAKDDTGLSMRVGQSGTLAVYGLGKFPEALYPKQWLRLLAEATHIKEYLEAQYKLYEADPDLYKAGKAEGQSFHDYPAKDGKPAFRAILTFEKQAKTIKLSGK